MKKSEATIEDLRNQTVSWGTHRPDDLIPKFMAVLKEYGKEAYDKYVSENPEVEDWKMLDDETKGWVVDELFDLLDGIAPEDCYFGAHPDDGADFGFWQVDENKRKESKKSEAEGGKDIFILDLTRIYADGDEVGLDDMQAAQNFYDEDEAIQAAKDLADSYKDDDAVVQVTVMAGEQEKPNGDIVGEPFDIFTASSSDSATTAKYREKANYIKTDGLDYYAKGGTSEAKKSEATKSDAFISDWQDKVVKGLEAVKDDYGFDIEYDEIKDSRRGTDAAYTIFVKRNELSQQLGTVGTNYFHTYTDDDFDRSVPYYAKDYTPEDAVNKLLSVVKGYCAKNGWTCKAESTKSEGVAFGATTVTLPIAWCDTYVMAQDIVNRLTWSFDKCDGDVKQDGDVFVACVMMEPKYLGDFRRMYKENYDSYCYMLKNKTDKFVNPDELGVLKGESKKSEANDDNWVAYYFCKDPQGLEWAVLPHTANQIGNVNCLSERGGMDTIGMEYVLSKCTPVENLKDSKIYKAAINGEDRRIVPLKKADAERIFKSKNGLEELKAVVGGMADESKKSEAAESDFIKDFRAYMATMVGEPYDEQDIIGWGWEWKSEEDEYVDGEKTCFATYTMTDDGVPYKLVVKWNSFMETINGYDLWQEPPSESKKSESKHGLIMAIMNNGKRKATVAKESEIASVEKEYKAASHKFAEVLPVVYFDDYDAANTAAEDWVSKGVKPKSESKKSESLTLKQKELKDMARYGEATDITTISDVEAKELKKKGIETVGISRGVYGMNGALLRDSEGNKYVITARSSNLFYFV